jgi:hypothetical protein
MPKAKPLTTVEMEMQGAMKETRTKSRPAQRAYRVSILKSR